MASSRRVGQLATRASRAPLQRASSEDGDYSKRREEDFGNLTGKLPVTASVRAYGTTACALMNCFAAIVQRFGQALRRLEYTDVPLPLPD